MMWFFHTPLLSQIDVRRSALGEKKVVRDVVDREIVHPQSPALAPLLLNAPMSAWIIFRIAEQTALRASDTVAFI